MDATIDAPPQPGAQPRARRLVARERNLTADPILQARTRAQVVAAVAVIPALLLTVLVATGVRGQPFPFPAAAIAGTLVFYLAVLGLAAAGWSRRVSDLRAPALIVACTVGGALGVSMIISQVPWPTGIVLPAWSPVAMWTFFVFVITTPRPRTVIFWGIVATATDPAMHMIYHAAGAFSLPDAGSAFFHLAPNLMAPLVAAVVSYFSRRMQRSLERAQEVGTYELTTLLGKGGMGEVWRAQHLMLKRPAAVKLIHPRLMGPDGDGERASKRFAKEAQATAALQSPHTIDVYDFGTTDAGEFFYVMELLEGIDLDTLVERFGPQPPERVAAILVQACHSLDEAHANGLVHRDIKPPNLFLCRYGQDVDFVKVLDFGLVKETAVDATETRLTIAGAISGTPAYMAPEQVMSEPMDGRTDVYLLGCVAWFLLAGRDLYVGQVATQVMFAHLQSEPELPSEVAGHALHGGLEELILACLAKKPADRPSSARELAERLRALAFDDPWTEVRARAWWDANLPVSPAANDAPAREAMTV